MALPTNPNRLSDTELASLLCRQASDLAKQLETETADLRTAGFDQVAAKVAEAIGPIQNLARAARSTPDPEKL